MNGALLRDPTELPHPSHCVKTYQKVCNKRGPHLATLAPDLIPPASRTVQNEFLLLFICGILLSQPKWTKTTRNIYS